ncbi:MAG: bifunctional 3-deoxy-7-phosphoheptulonate synthase/chorismate mutase [Deltaproteobacteria bacterium]|nr:bifunctional 3-deoxy-7-phosphoheptulonate synthase/chorismate mutase [Deltaproteobacteria bacterium]
MVLGGALAGAPLLVHAPHVTLEELREELQRINLDLLELLSRRARVVEQARAVKERDGIPAHVPEREQAMLDALVAANRGPFPDETVRRLFKEIFHASLALLESGRRQTLKVSRASGGSARTVRIGGVTIGGEPVVIAGPCAVEDEAQMDTVGRRLHELGVPLLRGGAFKARSSPYAFQGLGRRGLEILRDTGRRYGLAVVTEVTDTRLVELVAEHADALQIGSRNMHNYELLCEAGRAGKPVLLKRGLAATLEEFLWAAEYVVLQGTEQVVLCERGIRTFETQTRNTLDVSAIALLREQTWLPVIADVSHAAGRKDILPALARAALAAGAQGVMVEVHPCPAVARSDAQQQLDLDEFERLLDATGLRRRNDP